MGCVKLLGRIGIALPLLLLALGGCLFLLPGGKLTLKQASRQPTALAKLGCVKDAYLAGAVFDGAKLASVSSCRAPKTAVPGSEPRQPARPHANATKPQRTPARSTRARSARAPRR